MSSGSPRKHLRMFARPVTEEPSKKKSVPVPPASIQYSEGQSPIERLPVDLLCLLIEYVPEVVSNMLLTSRALLSQVYECARSPSSVKLVEKVYIQFNLRDFLTFEVPVNKRGLFELRLRLLIQRPIRREITQDNLRWSYNLPIADENELTELGGCVGRDIGVLIIANLQSQRKIAMLRKFLDRVKFTRLQCAVKVLSQNDCDFLLETVRKHKVETISMEVARVWAADQAKTESFLVSLASLVRSMRIRQLINSNIDEHSYFFGLIDSDWGRIVPEMFARKLDKLKIVSDHGSYLSTHAAFILRKKLPLMDKKLWFITSYRAHQSTIYHQRKFGDYFVGVGEINGKQTLRIHHLSRVNEGFCD